MIPRVKIPPVKGEAAAAAYKYSASSIETRHLDAHQEKWIEMQTGNSARLFIDLFLNILFRICLYLYLLVLY